MNKNDKDFEHEYDSIKDVIEFQNNMFNPGHYIGTGKVPPTISAPGNATPLAIFCFFASTIILILGLFLFISDINVHSSGLIEFPLANKIIALIIMLVISLFFLLLGLGYLKKAKKYYKERNKLKNEYVDEAVKDELWQRTCPKCGKSHDIDFPKCPHCKFDYLE